MTHLTTRLDGRRAIDPSEKAVMTIDMTVYLQQLDRNMGYTIAIWMQLFSL